MVSKLQILQIFCITAVLTMSVEACTGPSWIVSKSNSASNKFEARSWLITGTSMYPNDFFLKFLTYELSKADGSTTEAAHQLTSISKVVEFTSEPKYEAEITKMIGSLQCERKTKEDELYTEIFSQLTEEVQCSILKSVAGKSTDVLSKCSVTLVLIRRFPTMIKDYGSLLVDWLFAAELNEFPKTCLNKYRTYFVSEVLPLILRENSNYDRKIIINLLDKAMQYLIITTFYNDLKDTYKCAVPLLPDPLIKLGELLHQAGRLTKWNNKEFVYKDSRSILQHTNTLYNHLQKEHSKSLRKEFIYHGTFSLLYFINEISEYKRTHPGLFLAQQKFPESKVSPLKGRKSYLKEEVTPVSSDEISVSSKIENGERLKTAFINACSIWDKINSDSSYCKVYKELMDKLDSERWQVCLDFFLTSKQLYNQDYVSLIGRTSPTNQSIQNLIQAACCSCITSSQKEAFNKLLSVMEKLVVDNEEYTESPVPNTTFVFLYTHIDVYFICINIILTIIKECTVSRDQMTDEQVAHLLVLSQINWSNNQDLFKTVLNQLNNRKSFTYSKFFNYVIHLDILENISYLQTEQGGSLKLEILPMTAEQLAKHRTVTRGVKRDAAEDLKSAFIKQVSRSRDNLPQIIIQFLNENKAQLLQSVS